MEVGTNGPISGAVADTLSNRAPCLANPGDRGVGPAKWGAAQCPPAGAGAALVFETQSRGKKPPVGCVCSSPEERENANGGAPLAPTTHEHGALPASGDRDLWFHASAEGAGCRGPGLACVGLGARARRTFGRCLHLGSGRRQEGWAISSRLFAALARRSMTHWWCML